jgi:hypothetical protein
MVVRKDSGGQGIALAAGVHRHPDRRVAPLAESIDTCDAGWLILVDQQAEARRARQKTQGVLSFRGNPYWRAKKN